MKKILDYTVPLEGVLTKIHEKILWPVNEYIISVTGLPKFGDNEIETLLMQLSQEGIRDTLKLSQMTGLEEDLISFIQNRLLHKGFFDKFMQLTEQGEAKLSFEDNDEPELYSIFQDAISGKLLCKLIKTENQSEINYVEELEEEFDDFFLSTHDTEKLNYFNYRESCSMGDEEIEPNKILMLKRHNVFDVTEEQLKSMLVSYYGDYKIPNLQFSIVNKIKKEVFLTVDLILREGNSVNWVTTNGFGDIKDVFSSEFQLLFPEEQEYITDLRKKADKRYARDIGYNKYKKKPDVWNNYPEIGQYLYAIETIIPKINEITDSQDKLDALLDNKTQVISNIYILLEWILFYKAKENLILEKEALSEIKDFTERKQIGRYICQIIKENLGFFLPEDICDLFAKKIGSIRYSIKNDNEHELFSLLDLHIIIAKNNSEHWLHKLVESQNDLFMILNELKHERDTVNHTHQTNLSLEKIKEYYQIVENILILCFKKTGVIEVRFDKERKSIKIYETINEQINNESISWMEENLGFGVIYAVPEDFIRDLKKIGEACVKNENRKIHPAVISYEYVLLEKIFNILNNRTGIITVYSDQFKYAMNRAKKNGFKVTNDLTTLQKTKEDFIKQALKKKDCSLQADFLAWLITESDFNLSLISKECPNLPHVVNKVADLRGHTGIVKKDYTDYELNDCVKTLNKLLKTLCNNDFFYN